ncbi:hypothetical protein M948_14780 [Virgibacillus sp. CM-4]|nr:hypothetical protein M948_14780 [Virgibacillus sp. CM-4]
MDTGHRKITIGYSTIGRVCGIKRMSLIITTQSSGISNRHVRAYIVPVFFMLAGVTLGVIKKRWIAIWKKFDTIYVWCMEYFEFNHQVI